MATLSRYRPARIDLGGGQSVVVRVLRLSLTEARAFKKRMRAMLEDPTLSDRDLSDDEAAFVEDAFANYVSIAAGELTTDGGKSVESGAAFLALVGENGAVVMRVLLAIANGSSVSGDEHLPSASESVSVPSSDAPHPAPDGPTPALTVADAEQRTTALIEDATGETASLLSGATAILT